MRILVAGDFAPKCRIATKIEEGDYSCLDEIRPIIQMVDYSIVNLESPVVTREAKPIEKTGPNLCCTERAVDCLAQAGFNCVSLANNHFRDYGQIGVEDTLIACNKYEIEHVGGGVNLAEAKQILYEDFDGLRLAIINICENEWSIASDNYGGSAPLNPIQTYYSIQEAKNNSNYVLVITHGGIEGYQFPTPQMVETYRFFVDAGADAIVNHHQHCFSGFEEYKDKPIFYGLGNFCFDWKGQRESIWNDGYMVLLSFEEEKIGYEILPYCQCDEEPEVKLKDKEQRIAFDKTVGHINDVIATPKLLKDQFQEKVGSMYESRMLALEPFNNKFIKKLQSKRFLPRLIRNEQKKSMLVRICCESNRELLSEILKRYFKICNTLE